MARRRALRASCALIDAARASAFRHWITGIDATTTPHRIETSLRDRWRDLVFEVASWMPDEWQAAVAGAPSLADLPAIQHLARGGAALPWMRDDPVYRDLIGPETETPARRPSAVRSRPLPPRGPIPIGRPRVARRVAATAAAARGRRRSLAGLPSRSALRVFALRRRLMHALERELASHWRALRDPSLGDGVALRRALQARLALLFRRAMHDPAAAFIFFAQIALDLERLRGELVRRAAFPGLPLAGAA